MLEQWNQRVKQIRELHNGIESNLKQAEVLHRSTVQEAIKVGELLDAQRQDMEPGKFVKWIMAELPFSVKTAYNYLKLWEYRSKIVSVTNLQEAYRQVCQLESDKKRQEDQRKNKLIVDYQATGEKGEGWDRGVDYEMKKRAEDAAYEQRKKDHFDNKEKERQEAQAEHDRNWQKIIDDILKSPRVQENQDLKLADLSDDVRQKGVFVVLKEYIYGFDSVSRQLEAIHNLMFFLRRMGNELQTKTQTVVSEELRK